MAGGKIALILIIVLLVISALVFLVLMILYWNKLNSCLTAPTIYCPTPYCADGSNPVEKAGGFL
jgi:hypothetical protein